MDLRDAVGENEARGFIGMQYLVLQKPEPKSIDDNGKLTWDGDLVKLIELQANVVKLRGDRWVRKILDRCYELREHPTSSFLKLLRQRNPGGGRKEVLTEKEKKLIATDLRAGCGIPLATAVINANRTALEEQVVSESTVLRAMKNFGGIVRNRRKVKSGKTDETSDWAKARLALCKQLKEQLKAGARSRLPQRAREALEKKGWQPLRLDQILFLDEIF